MNAASEEGHRNYEERWGDEVDEHRDPGAPQHLARQRGARALRLRRPQHFHHVAEAVADPPHQRDEAPAHPGPHPGDVSRSEFAVLGDAAGARHGGEAEEPVVDEEHHEGGGEQQYRDRSGEAPVQELLHLLDDDLRDHDLAPTAEQRRGDEEAERDDEHEQRARGHSGQREREVHPPEGLPAPRSERARGERQVLVDVAHHREHGHDGERHERVHHADHHAREVVDELHGRIGETHRLHPFVDRAPAPEQHHPGEGAHQEARPEGHQHPEDEHVPVCARARSREDRPPGSRRRRRRASSRPRCGR